MPSTHRAARAGKPRPAPAGAGLSSRTLQPTCDGPTRRTLGPRCAGPARRCCAITLVRAAAAARLPRRTGLDRHALRHPYVIRDTDGRPVTTAQATAIITGALDRALRDPRPLAAGPVVVSDADRHAPMPVAPVVLVDRGAQVWVPAPLRRIQFRAAPGEARPWPTLDVSGYCVLQRVTAACPCRSCCSTAHAGSSAGWLWGMSWVPEDSCG
jgi:hypothetical protein